jgi:hypothetical protein
MKNTALLIVGSVAVLGIGVYFFTRKKPTETALATTPAKTTSNLTSTSGSTAGSTAVGTTAVGTTAVGSTAVGGSNVNTVIDSNGNLSGSTSGQSGSGSSSQTSVNDTAEYQRKLNLANIAFEELKLLKLSLANYVNKAGTCRGSVPLYGYGGTTQNCVLGYYTSADDGTARNYISKQIKDKEKVISDLGFKAVGDKLFAL